MVDNKEFKQARGERAVKPMQGEPSEQSHEPRERHVKAKISPALERGEEAHGTRAARPRPEDEQDAGPRD